MKELILHRERFPSPNPNVRLTEITYLSGPFMVKGLLAEPKKEGCYPGILYLRGGIKSVGMVRPARIAQFAHEGCVVFAPYYRGNRGGQGQEDFCGEDRMDAFMGYKVLEMQPNVEKDNLHVFGFSRGGVMALFTALEFANCRSLVTWGGVSNMYQTYEERLDLRRMMKRVMPGTPHRNPAPYDWRTPLHRLHELRCPVLIIHGERDKHVGFEHAKQLETSLNAAGKPVETWYYSSYTHYFPPTVNQQTVTDMIQWMKTQ